MNYNPFLISVCGNSGCGKTSFVNLLAEILNKDNVLIINTDDYHKWPRGADEWSRYTHLNPEANNLACLEEHVSDLKKSNSIYKLIYDHETGKLVGPEKVEPHKIIILEGLHTLFTENLRKMVNFKIFLDIHPSLNAHFKVHRDRRERGYSKEKILQSIKDRENDAEKYIIPQKEYADLIIKKAPLIKLTDSKEDTAVEYSFIHNTNIKLEPIYNTLKKFFKEKIEFIDTESGPTITTKKILQKDELAELQKTAKNDLNLDIKPDIFGLCQLITVYNLYNSGLKINWRDGRAA